MLSPVPAPSTAPEAVRPTTSDGAASPRQLDRRIAGGAAERPVRDLGQPFPAGRSSSSRSRRRRRGRWSSARRIPGPPASIQVSQSCGSSTAAVRAAFSGSFSAIQRSLVTVNDAAGTDPIASAQAAAPPRWSTTSAICGADRRSFHSSAGRTTCAGGVQRDHAVLLAADGDRGRPLQQPGTRPAATPPTTACGSTSVPGGMRGRRPGRRSRRRPPGPATPSSTGSTNRSRPPELRFRRLFLPQSGQCRIRDQLLDAGVGRAQRRRLESELGELHRGTWPPGRASTRARSSATTVLQILAAPPG